jgi:hypothetical protein
MLQIKLEIRKATDLSAPLHIALHAVMFVIYWWNHHLDKLILWSFTFA